MKRREFLQTFLGAAAAVAIVETLDVEMLATRPIGVLIPVEADPLAWDATYAALHKEALRLFLLEMATLGTVIQPGHCAPVSLKLGERLPDGVLVTDQCSVATSVDGLPHYVELAMRHLAARAADHGMDRFARMKAEIPGTDYVRVAGPLRMIVAYDIGTGFPAVRFDVIGGATRAGLKRRDARRVKAAIRGRLGSYSVRPIPV